MLASGSRDRCIVLQDTKEASGVERRWNEHKQEVCACVCMCVHVPMCIWQSLEAHFFYWSTMCFTTSFQYAGVWSEVVSGQAVLGVGRQRQQVDVVVVPLKQACARLQRPPRRRQGYRLVSPPTRHVFLPFPPCPSCNIHLLLAGLLASGGGTADRRIRFWNTLTLRSIQSIDTASQVCNLAWSKHSNELVCGGVVWCVGLC